MRQKATAFLTCAFLLTVACNDSGSTPDDGYDAGTPDLRGPCEPADMVGFFTVQHEHDYSAVSGEVKGGVVPVTVLEEVLASGDCRLLRRNNPVCDPACEAGWTCDFDGSCIPYPQLLDLGDVTVHGLNKDVTMQPVNYFDTGMPHPGFDPGANIRLETKGGDLDPITLYGRGVTPLALPDETWVLRADEPLEISWTPANDEQAEVKLRINIDQHGSTPVELWCVVEDTGSLTIPADVVTEFKGYGVSGYTQANVYRQTVDSVQTAPGCVEFTVFSRMVGDLQVEGHIPCSGPGDCPDGMTCDLPTNTCI